MNTLHLLSFINAKPELGCRRCCRIALSLVLLVGCTTCWRCLHPVYQSRALFKNDSSLFTSALVCDYFFFDQIGFFIFSHWTLGWAIPEKNSVKPGGHMFAEDFYKQASVLNSVSTQSEKSANRVFSVWFWNSSSVCSLSRLIPTGPCARWGMQGNTFAVLNSVTNVKKNWKRYTS